MEKNKLQCEIVQDLLPSYVDGLTNEVTNEAVEEHLKDCDSCTKVKERMQEKEVPVVDEEQRQEIDFLKKTRKKTRNSILVSGLLVVAIMLGVLYIKNFIVGTLIDPQLVVCNVSVSGDNLAVSGTLTDSARAVSKTYFVEEDGVVTLSFKGALVGAFHKGDFYEQYTATKPITQVRLGDRIVWENGVDILPNVSAVYNTKHAYVGEAPANGESIRALGMYNALGSMDLELQTKKEPYGIHLSLKKEIYGTEEEKMSERMKSYAYILLSIIDNLSYVSYDYNHDGEKENLTITKEDATAFAGMNIKTFAETPAKLQELMEKTSLNEYGYAVPGYLYTYDYNEYFSINIVNNTSVNIYGMGIAYYVDGDVTSSGGTMRADGEPYSMDEIISFEGDMEGLGMNYNRTTTIELRLTVVDVSGKEYEISTPIQILPQEGDTYNYILTGNYEDGFEISQ